MRRLHADVWVVALPPPDRDGGWSREERQRASTMRSEAARRRYLGSRTVLRAVLGQQLDVPPASVLLEDRPAAAPHLVDDPGRQLALAHAGAVVVLAVSTEGPIGVDIEVAAARRRPVPAAAVDPSKLAATRAVVGDRLAALGAWVAQEAALKLDGVGLSFPLGAVTLHPHADGVLVRTGTGTVGVTLRVLAADTVVGVATAGPPPDVRWHLDASAGRDGGPAAPAARPRAGPAGRSPRPR